ncbi:MAG: putative ABC transport system ATP-binding protein [Acidimicrobiales bacterium]|jgi:putative ABC transport system ATP-binding protein
MNTTATEPTPSTKMAARAEDAVKVYGSGDTEVHALRHVSVGFEQGKFTAIMGPSGSGKSTLMHCMAGLDRLSGGEAYVGDTPISTLNDKQLTEMRRNQIGFIFQSFNLVPTLNVRENITLPMDLGKGKIDDVWVDEVIATVGLADRIAHRPNELSGGQQQRVAVARALATRPDIVFGDEPTGNLDTITSSEILSFMQRAVRELGQTIVMVTHDPVSASYSDRVLFLTDGKIVQEMTDPTAESVFDTIKNLGG